MRSGDPGFTKEPTAPLNSGRVRRPERCRHGQSERALEVTAIITLSWSVLWEDIESGVIGLDALEAGDLPRLPKTIDFTVDYLRSGLPRDAYARARVTRSGRRYASVQAEAWQDNRDRPFAQAAAHFLMPRKDG